MDHSEIRHSPAARIGPDSVQVKVRVHGSPEAAWPALCDPARLAGWFGELDRPWQVGRDGRIDLGDGDFFAVTATDIAEGRFVEFEWRFLGVGPLGRIRWSVGATPDGAEITVEDYDSDRPAAEADELAEGWVDFFQRLEGYLATGESCRYDWRSDIDGSVELAAGSLAPLRPEALRRWLPIDGADADHGAGARPRRFLVADGAGPPAFDVGDWRLRRDAELTFSVEIPGAAAATSCSVTVEPGANGGSRLRFSHVGWRELGLPDGRVLALRRRFASTWTAALERLRELAVTTGGIA